MISGTAGLLNLVLGIVYTSYGLMTVNDMWRGRRRLGFSHFGLAWIFMAFTCGPHHLHHGAHILFEGRVGGPVDLIVVAAGFPAGVVWFLLRVEAMTGGRGDRFIAGTPVWVEALPTLAGVYAVWLVVAAAGVLDAWAGYTGILTPNFLLVGLYAAIGAVLLRTQVVNRARSGGWSVSGLSLSIVFPTCALMHAGYAFYASTGQYVADWHGFTIDTLAVPAAAYFLWVVWSLARGRMHDWNSAAVSSGPLPGHEAPVRLGVS